MRRSSIIALIVLLAMMAVQSTGCTAGYKPKVVVLNGVTGLGLAKLLGSPDYEVEVGKSADVAVARLTSKTADAAALPVSTAALLRSKGTAIRLAAITNYGSLYILTSGKNVDIPSIAASFLGVPGRGTMPDVTMSMLLSEYKVQGTGVQYYSSPAELANLLAAGRVEAALLPEPWVSQVLSANSSLKIAVDMQKAFKDAYGFDYPLSCVVVSESFATDRPAELKKLLEDIKASVAWVVSNPAKAALVAEERLSMEKGATEAAIPRCNFEYLDGLKAREAALAFYSKVLSVSPAMIGGKLPDEAFYISK